MTRMATGSISFIASIIFFLGALLLAPQTASAQDAPECDGEQQTIITATGIKITTCNWDGDLPVDRAAAGLVTTLARPEPDPNACLCDYDRIAAPRWKRFPDSRSCSGGSTYALRGKQPSSSSEILFAARTDAHSCQIRVRRRDVGVSGLTPTQQTSCREDIREYEEVNDILGDGSGGLQCPDP